MGSKGDFLTEARSAVVQLAVRGEGGPIGGEGRRGARRTSGGGAALWLEGWHVGKREPSGSFSFHSLS